ncbi:MAG: 1-deoxy-D-xylulose-5-phosphate reductoisomerase [Candidatus Abyssobacteria bacterium SURF_5]|uniref:1-deoxy-D-xylulose 5-phosphate reductoisomerase n=1 Tax=Abyssobacteria bacterium (strain SURF_5) TaxID=2093360 RepID=A0A3A4N5L3_ABYX5|nr:MAG: 1-deoxy-D-xylulose-5-phosphate reductoisomerase [Candidatus Abyssubacteria bacterium SURF_5]
MKKGVTILGATGSIGTSALAVIDSLSEHFFAVGLTAHSNSTLLKELIGRFRPRFAALADEDEARALQAQCPKETTVFGGVEGISAVAAAPEAQVVVSAIVGAAGLLPILAAIKKGKTVALANKEPLVMAGSVITALAKEHRAALLPVDSEHSAIFQCLCGNKNQKIHKIMLTASGGPFYNKDINLSDITPEQALRHPTWRMGAKISVDSATLMNKGLEVIEAHWLFGVDVEDIEVVIHPRSVVHSLVEFVDGSIMAQLSQNDMRLPIQYALTYPERLPSPVKRLKLTEISPLEFFPPSLDHFPCLRLAYEAGKIGGTMPAVLNAANEVAVEEFLQRRLNFLDIPAVIEQVMEDHVPVDNPTLDDILNADSWARHTARTSQRRCT